jgi:hypothetical protein
MKKKNDMRTKFLSVRLSKVEVAKLEVASSEANVSKGKYVREKLFGDEK